MSFTFSYNLLNGTTYFIFKIIEVCHNVLNVKFHTILIKILLILNQIQISRLFKRAVNSAGMEFKSNKLWTAFIDWEQSQSNLRNVTEIYDQLILTPTQQYIKNWQKYGLLLILSKIKYYHVYNTSCFVPQKSFCLR